MYESTQAFGELIQQDSRTFKALITLGDNIITDGIKSIRFSGGSNSEDDFSIGSAVSQYVEISIENTGIQFEGKEFLLQIGMLVNGLAEYVPIGYFTAEKPGTDEELISFTARDRMSKMDKVCVLSLPDNTDTVAVLKAIGNLRSVPVVTAGLTAIPMKNPKGYTCREVLSFIAQMYGGFAICNRSGQIEIKTYTDSGYKVIPDRYWGTFTHNDFPFIVEKLTCSTGEDEEGNTVTISAGGGARGFSFNNEFMTQDILNDVWRRVGNYTYMPGTVRFLGDPRIDPWDVLLIEDRDGNEYRVPAMKLNHEYDGGFTTEIEAVGKSESEQEEEFKGPLSQQMERLSTQLFIAEKAIIHKLDVDEAAITYATIANLDSVNANVEHLTADYADFKSAYALEFKSATADIAILNTDMANLKTFLAGNGAAGNFQVIHLTSENAVLDSALVRVAVMESVAVNDLLSGTISTDKFRIASDDGGISIEGATQQWKDENGVVRMQAGLDANGNFTFALFDASGEGILIDTEGIHEEAIADGLIVNSMVSDTANINASKLDIASLFREMNGSSEILYASRIWLDSEGQTLNQAYSHMSENVTYIDSMASTAYSQSSTAVETANAAASTAQSALSVLNGISTLDALGASLSNDAHVVHTNTDGFGGDYTDCFTKMTVYLGDTDVSYDSVFEVTASEGVTGYWDDENRTYHVTGMTTDNGYVDIDVLYGTGERNLTTRMGNKLLTRAGEYLLVRSGGSHITKRFSISKAPDGKIGVSHSLQCSVLAIRKQQDDSLKPSSVTFSALENDNGAVSSYSGRFKIEESTDDTTYTTRYESSADENIKIYSPTSADVKSIKCSLYAAGGTVLLDTQTVIILADAEGLADQIGAVQEEVAEVREVIVSTNAHVTNIETGIDGLRLNISDLQTDLHGLTDNTLLYNVKYHDNGNGTTTLTAQVFKDGQDVTKSFDGRWFTWRRRTEDEEVYLGYGYSITVKTDDYEFGGVCVGRFTTYDTLYLTTRSGSRLLTRSGKYLTVWKESA